MGSESGEAAMRMDFKYTRHQVARGARPDAESRDALFLIKSVSLLRLTYQIRLLAFRAADLRKKLIIEGPKECRLHPTLKSFANEHSKVVRVRKVE